MKRTGVAAGGQPLLAYRAGFLDPARLRGLERCSNDTGGTVVQHRGRGVHDTMA